MSETTKTDPGSPPPAKPTTETKPSVSDTNHRHAETEEEQNKRLEECFKELKEVCERHRCQIVPRFLDPIPVGTRGDTVQFQSTWDLGALPLP